MEPRDIYLKYSWALNLFLIAVLAFLAAQTTNRYLAGMTSSPAGGGSESMSISGGGEDRYRPSFASIVSRDLFEAAETAGSVDIPDMLEGDTAEDLRDTTLRLKLVGIAFFIDRLATIRNLKDQEVGVFRKGDKVTEDAKVHEIHMDKVILARASGDLEELRFEEDKKQSAPKRDEHRPISRPQVDTRPPVGPDLSDKIREVGENEFIIEKDAIDQALANMNSIITQARVIPNFTGHGPDRKVEGFRIYRIQKGSIFEFLGLSNGDVIKSINGENMDSVETGLRLLQSLRDESRFSLSIERRKSPVSLRYRVE